MLHDNDATLLGTHCQYTYCNQLDFLPFRCESCHLTYCLDHRTESTHKCPKAGAWAAQKRQAASTPPTGSSIPGHTLGTADVTKPCAAPSCKITIGKGLEQGVLCDTCRRTYCLKHRVKEDHACKTLIPIGARQTYLDAQQHKQKAQNAFDRFKAWGATKKSEAAQAGTRLFPAPKPTSASARLIATNTLKKTAKGDIKVPNEKRVYLHVEAEAATTTSKLPKGAFFYSQDWVVGRMLDDVAKRLMVENVNNAGKGETEMLRVFWVEGGRLLEFSEKVGAVLKSGETVVLLRGVGPAVPDLIGSAV